MRLGIFGGSFDPVHYGHLLLAESCREQCSLDQVWFLPAATAPHKRQAESAEAKHRIEMLRLALAGSETMRVETLEIDRGGVSYTVNTLAEIHKQNPDAELFLLMGADSLHDLPHWYKPEAICRQAIPVVVGRPGQQKPDFDVLAGLVSPQRLEEIRGCRVQSPLVDLSSSDIRQRVAEARSIRYRVSRAVEKYIETHGLYRG